MRAPIISFLCCIFSLSVFSQSPAIVRSDIAPGSFGGTYVATPSGSNFFAAEVIADAASRQIKVKKYDASGIISEISLYRDRCETCKTSENLPLGIFPTSDGGAIVYYEIAANTPIFRKITPNGRATWATNYNNVKFIGASPTGVNGIFLTFQVTSGSNANSYFLYSVDVNGIINWTKNLSLSSPNDLAATPDGGVVITDTDSTKRYDRLGNKLWAVNRGSNLVRVADSNFGFQADDSRVLRFSLSTGNIDFRRNQTAINDLLVTPDKSIVFSTETKIQKINTANTGIWTVNIGSRRLTLAPNGSIGSVGTGGNADQLTVYNANGSILWQKKMTYNSGDKMRLHAGPDNGWYVTTRGQVNTKPNQHGTGFLYRLASAAAAPCAYAVSVTPNSNQSICKTGSITFEASQPGLDLSYGFPSTDYSIQWVRNNGVVQTNALSYTGNQAGKYQVRIIQGNCVISSTEVDVNLLGTTSPSVTADLTELCLDGGASVRLTAAGCPANASVLWSDNQTGISVNASPNTTTDYTARCVQTYLQNGTSQTCQSDAGNIQRITILPTSNLTIPNGISSASAICKGSSEQLSTQISGGPVDPLTYTWTRNNTTISTQSTFQATQEGNYQVVVKDKRGCTARSAVKELKLVGTKIPTLTSNFDEICVNGGVSPVISLSGCTSSAILWNTGENTTSIRVSPTITTNYTAQCVDTFTAANGSAKTCQGTPSQPATLTVLQQSDIVITDLFAPAVFCKKDGQDTIRTEVKNFVDPLKFEWFKDGNLISTDLEIIVSDAGKYQLKVNDARGCTKESVIKDIERSELTVAVNGEKAFCEGTSTQLTVNANGGIGSNTYEWKLGGVAFSTATQITALQPGNYFIKVTDSKGCEEELNVPVELYPKIVAGYDREVTVKGNLLYSFDESKLLEGTRPFNINLSAISKSNVPIAVAGNKIGKFNEDATIYVRTTDANDCSFSDSINVRYVPCNVAVSISGDTSFCYYEQVTLQADKLSGVEPYTFAWTIGSSQFPNENKSTLATGAPGTYRITLTDSAQCVITSEPITIKDRGRDIVAFIRTNGDSVAYRPFGVDISAAVQEGVVYQWFRSDTLIINEVTPELYATETGKYMVRVSKDGCFNNSNEINIQILTPLSIERNNFVSDVTAFPNPTESQFIIRSKMLTPSKPTCRIIDLSGREIFRETSDKASLETEWEINASQWAAGVYMYHISTANGEASGKIVKR